MVRKEVIFNFLPIVLKVKCSSCNEVSDKWIYISRSEQNELKGGRGSANLVLKCKLCSRENNMGSHFL